MRGKAQHKLAALQFGQVNYAQYLRVYQYDVLEGN